MQVEADVRTEIKTVERLGKIPAKNPYHQIRSELQKEIFQKLNKTSQHIATLTGPKGIGKTDLALGYVYDQIENRNERNPQYDLVIWINCNKFDEEIRQIGRKLSIDNFEFDSYLYKYKGKWLLVLDNATVHNLKAIPDTAKGHIIITSRESSWINLIHVPHFAPIESQQLIARILNVDWNDYETTQRVIRIANELDDHPQAITDAMSELVRNGISLNEYYDDLIKRSALIYPTELPKGTFYREINDLVLQQKQNEGPYAYALLCLLAHMDSVFIPRRFIHELLIIVDASFKGKEKETQQKVSEILLQLKQVGLLR